jgi:hypothetical protein
MSAVWISVGAPPNPRPQTPIAHNAATGWPAHWASASMAVMMSAMAHSRTGRRWRSMSAPVTQIPATAPHPKASKARLACRIPHARATSAM